MHATCVYSKRYSYRMFVGNCESSRSYEGRSRSSKNNINMKLKEMEWEVMTGYI
jgi:hypothetical protein